jgi:hypothetical protein
VLRIVAAGFDDEEPLERDEDHDALDQTEEFPADELPADADELPARADLDEEHAGELPD